MTTPKAPLRRTPTPQSVLCASVIVALIPALGACGQRTSRSPTGLPAAPTTNFAAPRTTTSIVPSLTRNVTTTTRNNTTTTTLASNVYGATISGASPNPKTAGLVPRVYVPNSDEGTVSVIDPSTYLVTKTFNVGRNPQHIGPAWDLSTLYVSNDLGNSLSPIDARSGVEGAPVPVTDPYNLYFTPDGGSAIVVAERLRRLDFRDPHTWKTQFSIAIPFKGANHLDFTADGRTILLSCEFSGWLVRIDIATRTITGQLDLKGQPIDVKLSPDGKVIYVANMSRAGVSVVDPVTMKELSFIPTGKGAHGLYPSRDATKLYVANRLADSVSVIDFSTRAVVATWRFRGTPDMGGVSANGKELWLSGRYSCEVYVIDTITGTLTHRIRVGRGPHGLTFFPQPGRYSLGHTGNYR